MTDLAADNAKKISRWNSVSPHLAIKRYRKDGGLKSLDEILEEYRQARRKKRDQMWFLYIDLRKDFDEIERSPEDLDCEDGIFRLENPHGKRRWEE
jgi:hypothetical protein